MLLVLLSLLGLIFGLPEITPIQAQGGLTVEILAGYNLVVDSNVTSPSTYSPSAATVADRVCNNTGSDVTNVALNIGDYANSTPGIYPGRGTTDSGFDTEHPALAGTGPYAFTHEGGRAGLSDASRPLGTLNNGECAVQYWTFSYPRCENSEEPPCSGSPVWGNSVKPEDDLWLNFDVWATGSGVSTGVQTWTMHLRNEISAMANKIEPNGNPGGQWFNTDPATIKPGGVITTNGILYRIGNVRFGFDNNNDFLPDYNFWVQPIGDASQFDSGCYRLVKTSGVITVEGKSAKSFTFTDQLYFTNAPDPKYPDANRIPTDNTNVIGEVYYTFLALGANGNASPTPYQEAASGYDNEKFNGDFGAGGVVPVTVDEAEVTLDKSGDPGLITVGKIITYTLPFQNKSATESAGLILYQGATVNNPLVITDPIPFNTAYVPGSVTTNTGSIEFYDGNSWNSAETDPVTALRWQVGNLDADTQTRCVEFGVAISTTLAAKNNGLAVEYSPQGWIVRAGDVSALEVIGYTTPPTVTVTPTPTPVLTVTVTPTPAITPTITPTVTVTPTVTPIVTPTVTPTATPAVTTTPPVEPPVEEPIEQPVEEPTPEPTAEPTVEPTAEPTTEPTSEPTSAPTVEPTTEPTVELTAEPTIEPPVKEPPAEPVEEPIEEPVTEPTIEPTTEPAAETFRLTRVIPVAATGAEYAVMGAAAWPIPAVITPTGDPIVPLEAVTFTIVNTATIGSDETTEQTDTANKPVVRVIDPAISKTADPTEAGPGEIVRFYITIDNPADKSNAAATNVVVTDPLPLTVDLLDYSLSSIPAGVISSSTVTTRTVAVNHPDLSQTTASTITVNIPTLAPGEQVLLTVRTQVNALADPAPLTIENTASLAFDEGADRTDSSPSILVPEPPPPPHDGGDDDDDDTSVPPTPTPTPTPTPAPVVIVPVQPTPTLPVLYLPETGLREMSTPASSGKTLPALVIVGGLLLFGAWYRFRR